MNSSFVVGTAALGVLALTGVVVACDPQAPGTPSPSVVVVHDHQPPTVHNHTTVHVHGRPSTRRAPQAVPRSAAPRRSTTTLKTRR
ncbi:hypothetical protein ACIA7S_28750 [Streptomyces sp. NPDC051643]|uniref:hypothetical protein n=1 Tax=Streptomyces sp. NPDC051643 TaxID=3365665 RepID=UPI003787E44B